MATLTTTPDSMARVREEDLPRESVPAEIGLGRAGDQARPRDQEKREIPAVPGRIVVVGHGMVGQRFCEEIRAREQFAGSSLRVFGDEPPYDRVHLGRRLSGAPPADLALKEEAWFRDANVTLHADPVVQIDRERAVVISASGLEAPYDVLVLATGSQPVLGKIPGNTGRDVRPFRSMSDAEEVLALALRAREAGLPVAVVGAGLLGLELADGLLAEGHSVHVFDAQPYPLSRQIEANAGRALLQGLVRPGLTFHMSARIAQFREQERGTLVECEDAPAQAFGLVVLAMGVRPRDKLASAAGLTCDLFGGVEVDDVLRTSDPKIYAIGECARYRGFTFGLVAPGYAMAEVLAEHLGGRNEARFEPSAVGTRLKFEGLPVTVLGESGATGLGVDVAVYQDPKSYRRLVVSRDRLIGAVVIGEWSELSRVESALARRDRVSRAELTRFRKGEQAFRQAHLTILDWPETATVCTCTGVTAGALRRAREAGCDSLELVCQRTGASRVCGTCEQLVASLFAPVEAPKRSLWLGPLSIVAALLAALYLLASPIPFSDSIQEATYDALWRDKVLKQWTGFSLAGLYLVGLLMSVRKRLRWLGRLQFENLRTFHALVGVLGLVGLIVHTGLRLGHGLDRGLILVVLLGTLLGAFAALSPEWASERERPRLRRWVNRIHIYALWPLPVLLLAHIAKVYFF